MTFWVSVWQKGFYLRASSSGNDQKFCAARAAPNAKEACNSEYGGLLQHNILPNFIEFPTWQLWGWKDRKGTHKLEDSKQSTCSRQRMRGKQQSVLWMKIYMRKVKWKGQKLSNSCIFFEYLACILSVSKCRNFGKRKIKTKRNATKKLHKIWIIIYNTIARIMSWNSNVLSLFNGNFKDAQGTLLAYMH